MKVIKSLGLLCIMLTVSTMQSQTWQELTSNVPGPFITGGGTRTLASDGTHVYILGSTGVYRSSDAGASWHPLNTVQGASYDLSAQSLRFIKFENGLLWVGDDPGSLEITLGAAPLYRLTPGQTEWQKSATSFNGPAFASTVEDIAYDSSNGVYWLASAIGGVYRSTDGGFNWQQITTGLPSTLGDSVIAENGEVMVAFTLSGVWKSSDGGANWASTGIPGLGYGSLFKQKNRIYLPLTGPTTLQDGLYYTENFGVSWTQGKSFQGARELSSDGQIIYAPGFYSVNEALSFDAFPGSGLPVGYGVGNIIRHQNYVFSSGATSTGNHLYRLDVSNFDFRPHVQIVQQPPQKIGVVTNALLQIKVLAAGTNLTYQWKKAGEIIPNATDATFTIEHAQLTDSGLYTVTITDGIDTVDSSSTRVTVVERVLGKLDPSYDSTSATGGWFYALDDGSLVCASGNQIYRMAPNGPRTIQATVGTMEYAYLDNRGGFLISQHNGSTRFLRRYNAVTLEVDETFTVPQLNGAIRTFVELPGQGYIISGDFTTVDGQSKSKVALIRYDGTLDTRFDIGTGPNSYVWHVDVDREGFIYVVGGFSTWNGKTANGLIKLDRSGQIPPGYSLLATNQPATFVKALPNGKVFVMVGGSSQYPLLYNSDGTKDSSYNVAGHSINGQVFSLALESSGKVVLVGSFTRYASINRDNYLRLNLNGTLDTTFDGSVGPSQGDLRWVTADARGYLYISRSTSFGTFQESTGVAGPLRIFSDQPDLAIARVSPPQKLSIGGSTTLEVIAFGSSPLRYQWFRNGIPLSNATNSNFLISSFSIEKSGNYTVEVINDSGSLVSEPIRIGVLGAPEFLVQPRSGSVLAGTNYTFSTIVEGVGLTYAWRRNGNLLAVTNQSSLTLSNVTRANGGTYTLEISNEFGSLVSQPAVLIVNEFTGGIAPAMTIPSFNSYGYNLLLMPDNSVFVAGAFTIVSNQQHPYFTRLAANGSAIEGWYEATRGGVNGQRVNTSVRTHNNKIVIAGVFNSVSGISAASIARLNNDGSVDTSFNNSLSPNGDILALGALPNGKLLVGGQFGAWGQNNIPILLRLNENGSIDSSFTTAPNHYVNVIRTLPDGTAYIGGRFTAINGIARPSLARLHPDGTLDTNFAPAISGEISTMEIDSEGRILVPFGPNRLTRFFPNGLVDSTFAPTEVYSVGSIAIQLNGKILVSESFGGSLKRLFPNGQLDPYFVLPAGGIAGSIYDIETTKEGRVWVAGAFTAVGNDFSHRYVTQLTTDIADLAILQQPVSQQADLGGNVTFEVSAYSLNAESYQWFKNDEPISGATNSTLLLTNIGKIDAGTYHVVISSDGSTVTSVDAILTVLAEPVVVTQPQSKSVPLGSAVTFTAAVNGAAPLSLQWRKNGIAIDGETNSTLTFAAVTYNDAASYDLVAVNAAGTATTYPAGLGVFAITGGLDLTFNSGSGPNSEVRVIKMLPNGNIAIGGSFSVINGNSRNSFAILDSNGNVIPEPGMFSTPHAINDIAVQQDGKLILGLNSGFFRLNANGTYDNTFAGAAVPANRLLIDGDFIYVGGYKDNFTPGLRRWNLLTLELDGNFYNQMAAFYNGYQPTAILKLPDGRLLLGDGSSGALNLINSDGSRDSTVNISFRPPGNFSAIPISALARTDDGKIWVAGTFSVVNGLPRQNLVRLNQDLTVDTNFVPAAVGTVKALLAQGNNVIVAGQQLTSALGVSNPAVIRILGTTGEIDLNFGPSVYGGSVSSLAAAGDGKFYVGGTFNPPSMIARVHGQFSGESQIVAPPVAGNFVVGKPIALTVGWIGGSQATYQWYKDNVPLPDQTNQSLIISEAAAGDQGNYKVTVTTADGSMTSTAAVISSGGGSNENFQSWAAQFTFPGNLSAPGDDADGDGLSNIAEYAFGSNPTTPNAEIKPQATNTGLVINQEVYPTIQFLRSKTAVGVLIKVHISSSLAFADNLGTTEVSRQDMGNGTEAVMLRSNRSAAMNSVQFFKITVEVE
ncbi:MAG: immunoglobulin domain-containing protein [Verrucomicrobiota bacterium]|nr:immunoglobulin domain-containing protein [Verrucomicrobiota bacterium]